MATSKGNAQLALKAARLWWDFTHLGQLSSSVVAADAIIPILALLLYAEESDMLEAICAECEEAMASYREERIYDRPNSAP